MPKETIHSNSGQFHIIVGWQRDRDVQVGIRTADEQPLTDYLTVVEADSNGARTTRPCEADSLWGDLDRAAINELIRVLRRARDQAYGRDE